MSETAPVKKRYVVGFLVDKTNRKVLLVKKNRPEAWVGRFTGPGGKIEAKETPVQAMVREFREECGLGTSQKDWIHTVFLDTGEFTLDFFVTYGNPHKAKQMESEELVVSSLDEIPAKMFSNARWALALSLDESFAFPIRLAHKGVPCDRNVAVAPKIEIDLKPPVVPGAATQPTTPALVAAATGAVAGGSKKV